MGGDKLQDAFYIFHELAQKYGASATLLNGQAAALIQQGKYEEASGLLRATLDADSRNPETLINLAALSTYTGKSPDVVARYVRQVKDAAPEHAFCRDLQAKEAEFEAACGAMSGAVPQ